jgi:hypothetical protein
MTYEISTDDLTKAVAMLVAAAKSENLGVFKAECHDGSVLTIRFKTKPPKPSRLRALATGPVYSTTTDSESWPGRPGPGGP